MNKNGFTLVELLATIVIIALISGIATVAYTTFIKDAGDRVFKSYQDTMHAEAAYYLTNNYSKVDFKNNKAIISLNTLKIDAINNPNNSNDKCVNSYVEVTRQYVGSVLSMTYKVCLECPNTTFSPDFLKCKVYEN